ncbi:MAG: bactofilin family protein [Bacillota bacterium]
MFKKDDFEISSGKVDTIIGKDTFFKGSINGKGLIRIDGGAEGSISNKGDVIIGENGKVSVELKARNITIAGKYEGTLEAEGKLELKKTATAVGTFKANKLLIEQGAVITGNMEMKLTEETGAAAGKREWSYKPSGSESAEKERALGTLTEAQKAEKA